MDTNIDFDTINSLFSNFQQSITCDARCQRSRETQNLRQRLANAKSNLLSAPSRIQSAQRQFIIHTSGEQAYNKFQEKQLERRANETIQRFQSKVRETREDIQTKLGSYTGILVNFRNVVDLYKKYKRENAEMTKHLRDSTNDILTNERKTYYQDQEVDTLKYYYYYIILIVYIISVLCYGFFSLMYPSKTDWKITAATFIGLILLPFFSTWLLGLFVYILYEVYNLLPKNVYKKDIDEHIGYNEFKNM